MKNSHSSENNADSNNNSTPNNGQLKAKKGHGRNSIERVKAPSKWNKQGGKGSKKKWNPNDAGRYEIGFLKSLIDPAKLVNLPTDIPELVAHLFKLAIEENAHQVIYRAGYNTLFRGYFADNPVVYSGPDLSFHGHTMTGCVNKQQFLADLVSIFATKGWFKKFNPAKGGLVRWVTQWLGYAVKRTNVAITCDDTNSSFSTDPASAFAYNPPLDPKLKGHDAITIDVPLSVAAKLVEEKHRKDVEMARGWIARNWTFSAMRRRQVWPLLEKRIETYGLTKEEVGFPELKKNGTRQPCKLA